MSPIYPNSVTSGDVIFESKPLIHCIDREFRRKYCDNCVQPVNQLKLCDKCLKMYYCGDYCQQFDWIYHKNECNIFVTQKYKSDESIAKDRLLLRLYLCIKSDETFATKRHQLFDGSDICLNDIEVNGNELKQNLKLNTDFNSMTKRFINYGLIINFEELLHCFGLLLKIGSFNTIGFKTENSINFINVFGIYIENSRLSHSCIPNSCLAYNGLSVQLRAMKWIGLGEELTITRIPLAQNKTERQNQLKQLFSIDCRCDKCNRNLDSEVDYSMFDNLNRQLSSLSSVVYQQLFRDFVSQVLLISDQIFGEYSPEKTLLLIQLLNLSLETNNSKLNLFKKLLNRFKEALIVTHGVNHVFYTLFRNFFIDYLNS